MKKRFYIFIYSVFLSSILYAQITTIPSIISEGYTGTIKIVFDPTQGNSEMIDATECYAKTGVIIDDNYTVDDCPWYCVDEWRNGLPKYKMQKKDGKWK
jgi:hypothetical protein